MPKGLTAESVKYAKPSKIRTEIPDGYLPGLYLVVQPSGVKSWAVRYRFEGKPTKYTLGRYPALSLADARARGQDALRKVAEGKNPAADKAKAKRAAKLPTRIPKSKIVEFEAVVADFIERYAKVKTRDWKNTESMLRRHFVTHWKGMHVGEIQKSDVIEVLDGMVESGMGRGVDHAFAQLRRMYNWLIENDRLKTSPCAGLKKRFEVTSRDRVLTDEEVTVYWLAADQTDYPFGPIFKLLLLLGQRLNETAGMLWSEIDEHDFWSLPPSRTKNKKPHDLILPRQAVEIVRSIPRMPIDVTVDGVQKTVESEFVFTTTGRTPVSGFSRGKELLNKKMLEIAKKHAEEAGKDPNEVVIADFTNHDIRRTVTTHMAKLGIPPHVCEAVLNHISGTISGVAAVYNRHKFNEEKKEALQKWADHLDLLIAKQSASNVVPMRVKA